MDRLRVILQANLAGAFPRDLLVQIPLEGYQLMHLTLRS